MVEMDKLEELLTQFPSLKRTSQDCREKIKCSFTGHEMPVDFKAVRQYIDGRKYKNYLANPTFDYAKYEPHLQPVVTPHSKGKKQLFCQLTRRLINRDPVNVLQHVDGHRYQREKRRFDECAAAGVPFVPLATSKQKNVVRGDDDEEEHDEIEDKKFSSNPDASDSEEEEEEKRVEDDLSDLYPPEDFIMETSEEGENQEDLSSDEGNTPTGASCDTSQKKFRGIPFKMVSPVKRKKKSQQQRVKRQKK